MRDLEKEIKRVKAVIEMYKKEIEKTSTGIKRNILKKTLVRSEGVLIGLEKAKDLIEKEAL